MSQVLVPTERFASATARPLGFSAETRLPAALRKQKEEAECSRACCRAASARVLRSSGADSRYTPVHHPVTAAVPMNVYEPSASTAAHHSEQVLCSYSDHPTNAADGNSARRRIVDIYGPQVDPAYDVVEYEYPDGSGSWVQCAPEDLSYVAEHLRGQGCLVWVNGEDNA